MVTKKLTNMNMNSLLTFSSLYSRWEQINIFRIENIYFQSEKYLSPNLEFREEKVLTTFLRAGYGETVTEMSKLVPPVS